MQNTEHLSIEYLEDLFRLHYKSLCFAANNIVSDRIASEDIVQDVFLKLLNKKDEVKITTSIKGYLYKSTINTSLNYIEKNKRSVPSLQHEIELAGGVSNEVVESIGYIELEEQVTQAINSLPSKCKLIFILNRYEDMKYKQIADHLGIALKTVENQMGKALKKLRLHLQPYLSDRSSNSISS